MNKMIYTIPAIVGAAGALAILTSVAMGSPAYADGLGLKIPVGGAGGYASTVDACGKFGPQYVFCPATQVQDPSYGSGMVILPPHLEHFRFERLLQEPKTSVGFD